MKHRMSSEFIYQLFALLIAVIVVHAVYVGAIRPAADAQIQREMELQAAGEDYVPQRTFAVVIRDFEQEACFVLMLWAMAIMGYKARQSLQERKRPPSSAAATWRAGRRAWWSPSGPDRARSP